MTTAYRTPLRPRPGARATRVTAPRPPARQPVTNAEWFETRRRKARGADIFESLFGKLLERVKG